MKLKYLKATLCCLFFCLLYTSQKTIAQTVQKSEVHRISALMDSAKKILPIEKLFVHFDKPYYAVGDTIWLKAYLLNAAYLTGSPLSGRLYMEFINEKNVPVKRVMFPVAGGLSWGNIALNAKEFAKGRYHVNAYTNWMRNFGEDYIFKKDIFVGDVAVNEWEVSSTIDLKKEPGKAHVTLRFNQQDKMPLRLKALELTVKNGAKVLYRKSQETNLDGITELAFSLDTNDVKNNLVLNAKEPTAENDGQDILIPLTPASQNDIDLQFMPEGGEMVAGLPAHIGFKAIAHDGHAAMVNADVYNQHRQKITSVATGHGGMGAFDIIPKLGEKYSASITFKNGQQKSYSLPDVRSFGTVLRIEDTGADSLIVNISATAGGQALNTRYHIVGQARGIVSYSAAINITGGLLCVTVPKSAFPTGICRFTLLDNMLHPLNERVIFIDHQDGMHISLKSNKTLFSKRDSIDLEVKVTDENGLPVAGNFSVAVTDNAQVKADTSNNIRSYMLLTSDLKGEVEDPSYYFKPDSSAERKHDLDNLLLTQGWVGYNWEQVINRNTKPGYPAEIDFKISGRVNNFFNKPVKNAHVVLLSKKPELFKDTTTDDQGRFTFLNIAPLDTPAYVLQARNKRGNSFNVNIEMDAFKPTVFANSYFNRGINISTNDSTLLRYLNNNANRLKNMDNTGVAGHLLQQVNIKAKKIIKGSKNLNGPGGADIVLDQAELEQVGKKTYLELLQEWVPGFRIASLMLIGQSTRASGDLGKMFFLSDTTGGVVIPMNIGSKRWCFVKDRAIKFFVDGTSVMEAYSGGPHNGAELMMNYLETSTAEDVKGIEVMTTTGNTANYFRGKYSRYNASDFAIVEITTRSGHGPVVDNTIGRYLYKPLPFSIPAAFYRPKYSIKDKIANTDLRSTIHWEPNLVTDSAGVAHVSFYASDSNAGYTVILQGSDMNGNVGYASAYLKVTD